MSNNMRFSVNPTSIDIPRSRFNRSSQLKTTFNAGKLIPIYVDEVLPGDTFQMDTATLCRMSTPIKPVMDNANLDIFFFYVPNRLIWSHWKEFMGENNSTYWETPVEYTLPTVNCKDYSFPKGSVADYFGVPTNIKNIKVNSLPFRAYTKIWNDWFRDENLQQPALEYISQDGDYKITSSQSLDDYVKNANLGYSLCPVSKYHDYFTSALPSPQKHDPVKVGTFGDIPVKTMDFGARVFASDDDYDFATASGYVDAANDYYKSYGNTKLYMGKIKSDGTFTVANDNSTLYSTANGVYGYTTTSTVADSSSKSAAYVPINLYADIEGAQPYATLTRDDLISINDLRFAFQLQKLYERDARGGTRYIEILKSHFGVTSPDYRLQRSEYLGGRCVPISVNQVLQTSSTDETSPQGNTAAYSLTIDKNSGFTKSFTEHGYVIGVCCVRTEHTYQQGLDRLWSRVTRYDFYFPVFANIGEQAVLNKEIYAQGDKTDDEVFGYQEAWAEYRYKPSRVSGAFRSNYSTSLDCWHYADYYTSRPTLSSGWIAETETNIDRTLAVQSSVEDQFLVDFAFNCVCTRPKPMYSIPGLLDHH